MRTKVTQPSPPAEEVPAEVIATAICEIADAMKVLNSTRLKREAVVTLIHAQSKVAKRDIYIVLNNLEDLKKDWIKP